MFETRRPRTTNLPVWWRLVLYLALAWVGALAGCEQKDLGRSCSLGQNVTIQSNQGYYSLGVPECSTGMCVKPAIPDGADQTIDTGPYCSSYCTADADCDWPTRDISNPNDKRCKRGYTCAIAFGASEDIADGGKLCCQKICLCRDFTASSGPAVPEECQSGSQYSCSSPPQSN